MAGLLDLLTGQTGASPWNALYPSPLNAEADQAQQAREAAAAVLARRFRGASHAPAPEADTFGAGAVPFGFAGPGSMNVTAADIAGPAAAPAPFAPGAKPVPFTAGPVTSQPPAVAPASDLSSVNRNRAPDDFISVGDYQMPAFRGEAPAAPVAAPSAAPAVARGAPPAAAPFSLAGAGDGFGDRLMKGTRGFLGNLGNGPIGAIAGGLGALVTGQNTDPSSIAAEHGSMTARALLAKGASPAEVQAARYNPALMKALVENYYGKDRWNVVQVGEDADGRKKFMQQNQVDGTLREVQGVPAGGAPSGAEDFVTGPDGKRIPIPPGANRKEFIKQVTHAAADAATGKLTEAQAKASSFATRMDQAEKILSTVQGEGLSAMNRVAGAIPMAGNYLQSPQYQRYKQAASAFITAMLRQESGAAVNPAEFDRYEKELFPQPGDDPSVVAQKAQMRAAATEQMRRSAGPGFKAPGSSSPSGKTSSGITWSVN
ncbi:hypothetical protein [Bradyrhizobium retamae]|uniref:Uncharacterized protein n=1 Tax=Bradyrhizobium retamae TaxID=1300035 RepID=A0A0R3MP29_9BRAD|nr:hypothetical protein [Bradyrhizobium retamae]KRR21913.1 hypothetical protein CQ13_07710 [Bradyrhizobium retamae]